MGLLLVAPVPGGEGVVEALRDRRRLHADLQVEVPVLVDVLLRDQPHLRGGCDGDV